MENIKFIKSITDGMAREKNAIGNCLYFPLKNGNRIKAYCYEDGVHLEAINKIDGKVDCCELPFSAYFKPTQCSPCAPKWTQHIKNGRWYFSQSYQHVLPTLDDYANISRSIEEYIEMFE